jgi:cytidylate kinase
MNTAFEAELYAHAIATEREAARRYAELAERMAQQDERAAALFRWLAQAEARRLADLRRESAGLELPDPAVLVLALEMAGEEAAHAELITRLESQP